MLGIGTGKEVPLSRSVSDNGLHILLVPIAGVTFLFNSFLP
jgi:hypothetical protein